jgi:hydrogenase nickel incorporation protein HypB
MTQSKTIEIRENILAANARAAAELRESFSRQRTLVVNLISSPGSGKTTLLEATLQQLPNLSSAVLEGDIATERDSERIRKLGIPARQILTGGACHLDARLVQGELSKARFPDLDLLFIENVGNLICPTSYDLGEDFKVVLLSVAEGDDKPFKYPAIFSRASLTIISKMDLLPYVGFDLTAVETQVRALNPASRIIKTSARTQDGIGEWCDYLHEAFRKKRGS